jgi:HPt (histidine-containing phosphotransfer) domain-containing protein
MPVMDGFSATRRLREDGRTLPIIALTANAMKGFEQELLAAGCTAYLTKPVDIDRLLDTVAGILGAERIILPPLKLSPAVPLSIVSADKPRVTQAPVISRLAEHPRLRGVVRKFGLQLGERLSIIEEAQARLDYEQLAQLGHWLKGAAGTVGFDEFTEPARALEQAARDHDPEQLATAVTEVRDLAQRLVIPDREPAAPVILMKH